MNDIERNLRRRLKKSIRKRTELNNRVLEYQRQQKEFKSKLKEKLIDYFDVYKDCYFYVLTRDKSALQYETMSFDDFKEFDEEQIEDIVDFIFKGVE